MQILHSHTGAVAEVATHEQVERGSTPENVKGDLHGFGYLLSARCTGLSPSAGRLPLPLLRGKNTWEKVTYVQYTCIYVHLLVIYACILYV